MPFHFLSTQINLPHVFEMFALDVDACFESCTSLVNGYVNCALFNAVPNVYLYN